jgi:hypothetical protein
VSNIALPEGGDILGICSEWYVRLLKGINYYTGRVFHWALSIAIPLLDLSALILLAAPWCHVVDLPTFLCGISFISANMKAVHSEI